MLADHTNKTPEDWIATPHPSNTGSKSPWTHQSRQCADGQEAAVLSSLRIGEGEDGDEIVIESDEAVSAGSELD
jgi:hypothetical protein